MNKQISMKSFSYSYKIKYKLKAIAVKICLLYIYIYIYFVLEQGRKPPYIRSRRGKRQKEREKKSCVN